MVIYFHSIGFYSWNSASLKVAAALDYETTREYTVTIRVSDGEFVSIIAYILFTHLLQEMVGLDRSECV